MKTIRTMLRQTILPGEDRGSAMLIAMLIMVVLSLIGISFLVLSDTENKIATNERDDAQVLYVAEAGVEVVKAWFNQPNPAYNSIVPDKSTEVDLCRRKGHTNYDQEDGIYEINSTGGGCPEKYEGGDAYGPRRLFDKPYRHGDRGDLLGGAEAPGRPDLRSRHAGRLPREPGRERRLPGQAERRLQREQRGIPGRDPDHRHPGLPPPHRVGHVVPAGRWPPSR